MTRILVLLCAALSGCALIDQRTFDPQADMKPIPPPAPVAHVEAPEPGPKPLLTARLPTDAGALRADVAKAVAAARSIKPDVAFDVVEVTPNATAGQEASEVARLIVAQGVRPDRVTLAARPVPNAVREVRVYVH